MWTALAPAVDGTYMAVVHANCPCNELAALCLRQFRPVPHQVFGAPSLPILRVFRALRRHARRYDGAVWTREEVVGSYAGAMRRKYEEAARSLRFRGLSEADYRLDAFLKAEKPRSPSKVGKPRMIYPRSPRYNLELARYLKPLEHWLWGTLTLKRLFGTGPTSRVVAKGLNPRQRANLIARKLRSFEECVCFEVDGSAFEAHLGPVQLQLEHLVYLSAYEMDAKLRRLLAVQLELRGRTSSGIEFWRPGGRASGDVNTGMGNTLVMLAVVAGVLRHLRVDFDLLVDGDNALVFLPGAVAPSVCENFARLVKEACGHEMKLCKPVTVMEEIRFGGSAPINLGPGGWTMVRDWERVLGSSLASHVHLREPKFAVEWMAGVAQCELSLALGVPVLQEYFLQVLRRIGPLKRPVRTHPLRDYFLIGAHMARIEEARPVLDITRISFERAFGVPVDLQRQYEALFAGVTLPTSQTDYYKQPLEDAADVLDWVQSVVLPESTF